MFQLTQQKARERKYKLVCTLCKKSRDVTYSMYRLVYPIRSKKPPRSGNCVQCLNNKPNKGSFKKNQIPWNKGDGNTKDVAKERSSRQYRLWRKEVLKRDGYQCTQCKSTERLCADHIKSFTFYPELRYEISNGRTLCKPCHLKTDNYGYKEVKCHRGNVNKPRTKS